MKCGDEKMYEEFLT